MRFLTFITITTLLLAGCAGPQVEEEPLDTEGVIGGQGQGGGSGAGVSPTITSFVASTAAVDNSGAGVIDFTFTAFDGNGEGDFTNAEWTVTMTGPQPATFTYQNQGSIVPITTEPAAFDDGWKVWNSGASLDGTVTAVFRYVAALGVPPGEYTATPTVDPTGNGPGRGPVSGDAVTFTVSTFSEITIDGTPCLEDGSPDTGQGWGGWEATPGASLIEATNFLCLTNTGQKADATVVIDFTPAAFAGAETNGTLPITSNLEFTWWEGGAASVPADGQYTYLEANADGTVAVTFTGLGNRIFVSYRILEVPDILPEDDYAAAYTATEI